MSLANQIFNLPPDKLHALQDTLVEMGVAFELGSDHRAILRRAKNRHGAGLMRRIYTRLLMAPKREIDTLLKHLTNST